MGVCVVGVWFRVLVWCVGAWVCVWVCGCLGVFFDIFEDFFKSLKSFKSKPSKTPRGVFSF